MTTMTYTVPVGQNIEEAAEAMLRIAKAHGVTVVATFNDVALEADPRMCVDQVVAPLWRESQRRKQRSQALAAAEKAVVDAAVAVHVGRTVNLIVNMDRLEAAVKALLALRTGRGGE